MTLEQLNRGIQLQNEIWKLEKIIQDIREYGSFVQDCSRVHISSGCQGMIVPMLKRELVGLKEEFAKL